MNFPTCRSVSGGFLGLVLLAALGVPAFAGEADRVQVNTDYSEADAVLSILAARKMNQPIPDKEWQALFASEPYQRLKKREAAMHRAFTDDDFKKFVLSDDLLARYDGLRQTVAEWKQVDLGAYGRRILQYLPSDAVIRAKVFPMIKPLHNSFVFDVETDPAIFLYLDPSVSKESFANTAAHEMHHIGFASAGKQYDQSIASLPSDAHAVADWMGAFGEGEAVLAAAGGPDVDPTATFTPELKANWERGKRDFNQDLLQVNAFFLDVLTGKLKGDAIQQKAMGFFGLQGPWYTVGYRMAVMVEKHDGRAALIRCIQDPRLLLARYNELAEESNRHQGTQLALWSPAVLEAVNAPAFKPQ